MWIHIFSDHKHTEEKRNFVKRNINNRKVKVNNIKREVKTNEVIKNKSKENLKIIPLGGLQEIGKNMTVFEYGNDIYADILTPVLNETQYFPYKNFGK